jgi:hypothetical protein
MKISNLLYFALLMILLSSCSEVGLLSEKNSWILDEINSVSDFFKVYFMIQLSMLIFGLLLSSILDNLGKLISLVAHFIWIIYARDYGFFTVLLLFGLLTIISILFQVVHSWYKGYMENRF